MTQVTGRPAEKPTRSATGRARSADPAAPPRWLEPDEREAWLGLLRVLAKLPPLLDAQLERSAGLTLFEYTVLAMLSEQSDRALRMSRLATLTNASPSRLSHAARHLEGRRLLVREGDPDDGRCIRAVLTAAGLALVEAAAPGHVRAVRELFVDALHPEQLRGLREANQQILRRIDPDQATRPPWLPGSSLAGSPDPDPGLLPDPDLLGAVRR
jgi:DNA-binding MarR family transcriptional regulator